MKQCRVIRIDTNEVMIEAGIPDSDFANFLKSFNNPPFKVEFREHTEKDTKEFWKDVKGGTIL